MKRNWNLRFTDMEDFEWDMLTTGDSGFGVEDRIVLEAALSELSEEESQIVMLHAVGGMKHREIAQQTNVIISMVGYPSDVEEIYLGEQGLIECSKEGTLLIDMTTSTPSLAMKIAEKR